MKKTERHQIKRDELVTVLERGTAYVEENARRIVVLVGGVVLVAVVSLGARYFISGREGRASFLLGQIIQTHHAPISASLDSLQQASSSGPSFTSTEDRDRKIVQLADEILSRYPSSHAAAGALYYKGLSLSGLKQTDDAIKGLQDLVDHYPGDFLAPMARYQLAHMREAQGKPADALTQYQALADDSRGFFPREEGLMGVARCQEALGHRDEALKTYRKIVSDFPNSDYQFEAKKKVDELS